MSLTRRSALGLFGLSALGTTLAACAPTTNTPAPAGTEGLKDDGVKEFPFTSWSFNEAVTKEPIQTQIDKYSAANAGTKISTPSYPYNDYLNQLLLQVQGGQLTGAVQLELTIASVEAIALAAPFANMFDEVPDWLLTPASSHRVLPRLGQYTTLVRIRTVDGLEGIGEAYGLPEPRVTATIIGSLLAPMLIGRDAGASEALWELMYGAQAGAGRTGGFYLEAISGIDLALWDLRGKAAGQPVHRLLGGPVRTTVPVYASPIPFLPTVEQSAERALAFLDDGFHAVKLKLGRGETTDLAHATAVTDALDGRAALHVDLNCAYDVNTAIRLGHALQDLGIRWLEEPLPTDDVAGLAEVRSAVRIPVVTGESEFTRYGYRDLLLARAADIVMPNLTRAGGITEVRRIAALCSAFHVDVSPHGVGSAIGLAAALQLAAATPNVPIHEYNRLPNPLRDDLAAPPSLVDGALAVSEAPGLGVTLDEDLIAHYEVFRA